MVKDGSERTSSHVGSRVRWWNRGWVRLTLACAAAVCLALFVAGEYILHNAEPILRKRIIETLAERFGAPVELDRLDISLLRGIEANGYGLRIGYNALSGPGPLSESSGTMLRVEHFAFRTGLRSLLRQPTHVALVRVEGMELHIPPPGNRGRWNEAPIDPSDPKLKPKIAFVVNQLECRDVRLFIESGQSGPDHVRKPPLQFDIAALDLTNVGRNQAMLYDAQLTNPKPIGAIHATGHFGPWANGLDKGLPGQTPIDGDYSFDGADLGTIRGIGGTLSSAGHFGGILDRIAIDGHTDTPHFSLDLSRHSLPLHTEFHAVVDGTDGDTYLEPVRARLASSFFTTRGKIVKIGGEGHDIQLDVDIPHGAMQDFLELAVKTDPPLLSGALNMHARLHIPPGRERVAEKLSLVGSFSLNAVRFNRPKLQDRVDALSAKAQGKPQDLQAAGKNQAAQVRSQIAANISINRGVMSVTDLHYSIPGAAVLLNGVYSMDGKLFEFRGHVRTEATASQMVGGWKGMLLQPFDRLLQKHGAGLELPVEISGTEGDPHFGLAMHGADATPAQMLADVKGKRKASLNIGSAREESSRADAEDAAAARAPTLAEAERLHAAAVRDRDKARRDATAAQDVLSPQH